ncbi:TonB-dependent receptor [Sphingobacterium olei]|uniref:TonB-dependent receptor n=1 Tax=Sphingobacterium olei TaxID=2571155 RepID=A0A4U0NHN2_9SPHI|nr:TonB-dependent receptor [Sphingobacterium olei]TJZ53741.1 TonB-dependent receptor [Sphingobacterium olei]
MREIFTLKLFFLLMLTCSSRSLYAQGYAVSGTVTDVTGRTLAGVLLVMDSLGQVGKSKADGSFLFERLPPEKYLLTARSVGFKDQQIKLQVKDQAISIRIVMEASVQHIEEVLIEDGIPKRKREESLNLDIVNHQYVQKYLGGSLMKSLERLPGISTIGIGSGQSKPLIRGMGFNRVVVFEHGLKHEGQQWGVDHGLEIDQFAAGEIEVIKGAASFMYGSDAIGGVIDVKPELLPQGERLAGSVNMIGKSNSNLYGGSVNLGGETGKWLYNARLTSLNYGDYRTPTDSVYVYSYAVPLHKQQVRNTAGRELNYHFNAGFQDDRFRSVLSLSSTFNKSGFFANAHGLEPRRVDTGLHDKSSRDILLPNQQVRHLKLTNQTSYQMGIHDIAMNFGFQHNFRQEHSQYVNHGYMPPTYPDTMSTSPILERQYEKEVYALNVKDSFILGKHRWTVGANTEYQQNTIGGWGFLVPEFNQSTFGLFVYDKYTLRDNLILHGALRYDYTRLNAFEYRDWFPSETGENTDPERLLRAEDMTRRFNSLVWSAGVNYNPDDFTVKLNMGKSFRVPIAKELAASGVNYHYFAYEQGDATLSPEESYQVDLGLGWSRERWSVQVSPFYNYFTNYIFLNPTARFDHFYGAGNQVFQYAESSVARYGGELQIKYNFWRDMSTEVLGEYLHARQLSGSKKGFTLPFSPPPSVLLNLSWTPSGSPGLDGSYLSVDYLIKGTQNNIVPPEKKTEGYSVVNLQAGFYLRMGGHTAQVSIQAQNLLNKKYLDHTSFYRLIELPEAGRNIVLSLKVPFNLI